MIKRFLMVLAMVAALIGFGATAPAMAAANDCTGTNMVCFWTDRNFSGSRYQWSWGTVHAAQGNCIIFSSGIDNKTSSILSLMTSIGNGMGFYDGYGGGANVGKNGTFSDNDLRTSGGGFPDGWNDRISSICAF